MKDHTTCRFAAFFIAAQAMRFYLPAVATILLRPVIGFRIVQHRS